MSISWRIFEASFMIFGTTDASEIAWTRLATKLPKIWLRSCSWPGRPVSFTLASVTRAEYASLVSDLHSSTTFAKALPSPSLSKTLLLAPKSAKSKSHGLEVQPVSLARIRPRGVRADGEDARGRLANLPDVNATGIELILTPPIP